jgi:hypothetical protein
MAGNKFKEADGVYHRSLIILEQAYSENSLDVARHSRVDSNAILTLNLHISYRLGHMVGLVITGDGVRHDESRLHSRFGW